MKREEVPAHDPWWLWEQSERSCVVRTRRATTSSMAAVAGGMVGVSWATAGRLHGGRSSSLRFPIGPGAVSDPVLHQTSVANGATGSACECRDSIAADGW